MMQIRQDPVTMLWCREDGAVCMPPTKHSRFKKFRWTFGSKQPSGYLAIRYRRKYHATHRLVCRAFHGLPPAGKPEVDHINRIKVDNRPCNLRFASRKENEDNKASVDTSIEKYGIRFCEDRAEYKKSYNKAHREEHREERKAYMKAYRERRKSEAV